MRSVVILPQRTNKAVRDQTSFDACAASIDALHDLSLIAKVSEDVPPFLGVFLDLLLDHLYIVKVFSLAFAAGVTFIRLKPSETYLLQVRALAAMHIEESVIEITFRHGWPILSLVGYTSSMAEAAGASSLGRGGAA